MPERSQAVPSWPARQRDERGAVLVEFALLLPLIMGLVLGIFTGGTAYFRKIAIVDAVREGSRYATVLQVGGGVGGLSAWETKVKNRVAQASGGELSPSDVCVKLVSPIGGTDCGVSDPPNASTESAVRVVKVSASKNAKLEFLFFTSNPTLTSKLAARYERDTG